MSCDDNFCGTGIVVGSPIPKPGDPDNNAVLTATPAYGGINVRWTLPGINSHAVVRTDLYRNLSEDLASATLLDHVGGGFYFDRLQDQIPRYYWIRFVTVNGTVLPAIGPASAAAMDSITEIIEQLTGRIDAGVLAQSLKEDIGKITLNYAELTSEIAKRIAGNAALAQALADVQNGVTESLGLIHTEVTTRQQGQNALASQLNVIAAVNAQNAAAIIEERTARVNADSAQSSLITQVAAATGQNASAIQTEVQARTTADSALGSRIDTVQSTLGGQVASVQQTMTTTVNKVGEIGALWTARTTVNGLIGGFGVYNDGRLVDAGFDVDRFWVGRTDANKRKPFIIEGDTVYIAKAVIKDGDIDSAKIGQLQVKAANIDNLTINGQKIENNAIAEIDELGDPGGGVNFAITSGATKVVIIIGWAGQYNGDASYGTFGVTLHDVSGSPIQLRSVEQNVFFTSGGSIVMSAHLGNGIYRVARSASTNASVSVSSTSVIKVKK